MAVPVLRARSATEIVDASFQILRAHFGQFVMCSAIGYTPLLLVQLLIIGDPRRFMAAASADPLAAGRGMMTVTVTSLLAQWLTFTLMSAVLLICASQAYLGDTVDVGAAVRRALPRLPQVLVAALIRFGLMLLAFMFFVFPVLYVAARYFAVTPAVILENEGILGGFGRSSALSRGRKWHILNTLGLAAIIYWVLVIGVSLAFSLFGMFVLQTVGSAVATVLVYPVVAITQTLLYYDARIQSEGLDIELMTGALAAAASAPSPIL
jgi:hypothetical protein